MKKYTNKILLITLISLALLMVVLCTVNVRVAFHNGKIKTIDQICKQPQEAASQRIIINADTVMVVNAETEIDE